MAASLWTWVRWPIYFGGGLFSAAGGALYYFQNELIYPRNLPPGARSQVPKPHDVGMDDSYSPEELFLNTPDGESINAFLIRPPNRAAAKPVTVISFHGNAGNVGHRLPIAKVLARDVNCTTLMVEYRGYGLSSGNPGEKGIRIDAQTALDYVRQRPDLKNSKIVVYGQSLGGAVAIDLVARNKGANDIAGLLLENTFLSLPKMVPHAIPPAKYLAPLCHEQWNSEDMLPQITDVPILFLSGLKDEIVPPAHMKQLFRLAKTRNVVWRELPNGDHNNSVAERGYFEFIDNFLANYVL